MNKLLLLFAIIAFSFTSAAQETKTKKMHDHKHYYEMKDGKMMERKDGKSTMMTSDVTLKNGTVIMTNGMVKMKDGKTMQIKEGECVGDDGKIESMKMHKHDDTKMEKK